MRSSRLWREGSDARLTVLGALDDALQLLPQPPGIFQIDLAGEGEAVFAHFARLAELKRHLLLLRGGAPPLRRISHRGYNHLHLVLIPSREERRGLSIAFTLDSTRCEREKITDAR